MTRFTDAELRRLKANMLSKAKAAKKGRSRKQKNKPTAANKSVRSYGPRKRLERNEDDSIRIELPAELDNGNIGRSKHWSSAAKMRQHYASVLSTLYYKATPPDFQQHIVVTRVLGKGQRLWDADSVLRGSAKELIDGLVDHGLMHDDGPKWIVTATGKQNDERRDEGPLIIVELYRA